MTRQIPLRNRKGETIAYALVDDADFEWLSQWAWCISLGYAVRSIPNPDGSSRQKLIRMHRLIMDAGPGDLVDHRNFDKLDNQRSNLRKCTLTESQRNRRKFNQGRFSHPPTSKYKGVHWRKARKRWEAGIRAGGKYIYIGRFRSEQEAAHAYDEAARKYHGEFASTNF